MFFSLLDEIKDPYVKKVLGILNAAKSKAISKWRELVSSVDDQCVYIYTVYINKSHSHYCSTVMKMILFGNFCFLININKLNSVQLIHSTVPFLKYIFFKKIFFKLLE